MEIHHRAYVAKALKSALFTANTFAALQSDPKQVAFQVEEGNWSDDDAFRDDPILKTIDGVLKQPKAFCHWFTIASARKEASDERKPYVGMTKVPLGAVQQYNTQEAIDLKWWAGSSMRFAATAGEKMRENVLQSLGDAMLAKPQGLKDKGLDSIGMPAKGHVVFVAVSTAPHPFTVGTDCSGMEAPIQHSEI